MTEPVAESAPRPSPTCPWCAAPAAPDAIRCTACGAALAQRESIGDLQIPGLTSVDPALADFDKRPLQLRGPSPSQGVASSLIAGAVVGGPIGLVAIGGVAAVAAAELLGTKRGGGPAAQSAEDLGKPCEAALQALEHLENAKAGAPKAEPSTPDTEIGTAALAEGESSVWRDLPPER